MSEFTHRLPHQPWSKPSRNEAEYFKREEFRMRMEAACQREAERAEAERLRWLEEHGNHCPKCGSELQPLTTRSEQGDQCPCCLGVWLDHEVFDHLTRPEERNDYLTEIFRGVFLQYTTGCLGGEKQG
jgi:hypothetical protein